MKLIMIPLALVLLLGCSARRTTSYKDTYTLQVTPSGCAEYLAVPDSGSVEPVRFKLRVDSLEYNHHKFSIGYEVVVTLYKQSPILVFGDSFGIKLFHTVHVSKGKKIHKYSWDFLRRRGTCWTLHNHHINDEEAVLNSWISSHSMRNDTCYFKIRGYLGRVK